VIVLSPPCLKQIVDATEAAYPDEACGLLVGRDDDAKVIYITEVHQSENLADDPRRHFEVDPALRLGLHKRLRDEADTVVGLFHSHPDQPAQPSETDLTRAWEPELIWLITSVVNGQAVLTTGHRLSADGTRFEQVPLRTDDWAGESSREPMTWPGMR
jgi:proteasome lid subunit RPN8/RPN11